MRQRESRLGEFDVAAAFEGRAPALAVQAAFGLVCSFAAIFVRALVDGLSLSAGPFSLIYPAILISTLFGRWQAGAVTWVASFLHAWYFVLPLRSSFAFDNPDDLPRTVINGAAALVIVVFAEIFRRAVRRAVDERDAEIAFHELLIGEIDHRTKNSFALVAALLNHQKRRHKNPDVVDALQTAVGRVHSFAEVHRFLTLQDNAVTVEMRDLIEGMVRHLEDALFAGRKVSVSVNADPIRMPSDKASAIGLLINEVLTNAAKHAFIDGARGAVAIAFTGDAECWRLVIEDDGRGMADEQLEEGLGASLISGFAERAGGTLRIETSSAGTRVILTAGGEAA